MHPHTVDWLRNVELNVDVALAKRRWDLATKYEMTQQRLIDVLRVFLFEDVSDGVQGAFTRDLLALDIEFPVSGNRELLRIMAGLAMVGAFAEKTVVADAFALALQVAAVEGGGARPALAAVVEEAQAYRLQEAARLRPDNYSAYDEDSVVADLTAKRESLVKAEESGDAAAIKKAAEAYHLTIAQQSMWRHVRRLAEETQVLWWAVSDHSVSLGQRRADLHASLYALPAAVEASAHVQILPAPPAVEVLIERALAACRNSRKSTSMLELLDVKNARWLHAARADVDSSPCQDLVPVCTAVNKTHELGDPKLALAAVKNICHVDLSTSKTSPSVAACQYYREILFLRVLKGV